MVGSARYSHHCIQQLNGGPLCRASSSNDERRRPARASIVCERAGLPYSPQYGAKVTARPARARAREVPIARCRSVDWRWRSHRRTPGARCSLSLAVRRSSSELGGSRSSVTTAAGRARRHREHEPSLSRIPPATQKPCAPDLLLLLFYCLAKKPDRENTGTTRTGDLSVVFLRKTKTK